MESSGGRHSSIVFCTNGVLLRILVNTSKLNKKALQGEKDDVSEITHIIVVFSISSLFDLFCNPTISCLIVLVLQLAYMKLQSCYLYSHCTFE